MVATTLTMNEMVEISGGMIQEGSAARRVLDSVPLLSLLIPMLTEAHEGGVLCVRETNDVRDEELSQEAAETDALHDRYVTGIHGMLTACATLTGDTEYYLTLAAEVLPQGVAGAAQLTYAGEAGNAKRVRARLTPEVRGRLLAVPVGEETLLDYVERWLAAADRLGAIELERRQLRSARALANNPSWRDVRLSWMRAINALRYNAELAGLDEQQSQALFGALDAAETRARERSARRRSATSDVAPKAEAQTSDSQTSDEASKAG